jgi:hypothetical protein
MLLAYRRLRGRSRVLPSRWRPAGPPAGLRVLQNTWHAAHRRGRLPAALAACDAMTAAGQRGPWAAERGATLVMLKEHWHRAYLLRMVAVVEKGAKRAGACRGRRGAQRLPRPGRRRSAPTDDSIAVLDGFFAVHGGDQRAALAAARAGQAGENDDVEDLYLTQMAFDAAATRQARRRCASASPGCTRSRSPTAVMRGRGSATRTAAPGAPAQSPRHPAAPSVYRQTTPSRRCGQGNTTSPPRGWPPRCVNESCAAVLLLAVPALPPPAKTARFPPLQPASRCCPSVSRRTQRHSSSSVRRSRLYEAQDHRG